MYVWTYEYKWGTAYYYFNAENRKEADSLAVNAGLVPAECVVTRLKG